MDSVFSWLNKQAAWDEVFFIILFTVIIYFVGSTIITFIIKRAVRTGGLARKLHKKDIEKRQKTLVSLFATIWRVIIITLGAFMVLRLFFDTLSLAPLFASAGIVGVALGFGSQALVKDFLSGLFIIAENQYRIGDTIMIGTDTGVVEKITARSTVIRDEYGNVHYFPNGTITHVVNKTMLYSVVRFPVTVKLDNSLDDVIALVNQTGVALSEEKAWKRKILTPPAFVSIGEVTSTTVELIVSGRTQPSDQWDVTAEMRMRLLVAFEKNAIAFGK